MLRKLLCKWNRCFSNAVTRGTILLKPQFFGVHVFELMPKEFLHDVSRPVINDCYRIVGFILETKVPLEIQLFFMNLIRIMVIVREIAKCYDYPSKEISSIKTKSKFWLRMHGITTFLNKNWYTFEILQNLLGRSKDKLDNVISQIVLLCGFTFLWSACTSEALRIFSPS